MSDLTGHPEMASPRLNFDVLLRILEVQDTRHVVSMMQTCWTLQRAGAPLLLEDGVQIYTPKTLNSFYQFMFSDKTRFRYLWCLELALEELPFKDHGTDETLSRIFRHATQLEELSIQESDFLDRYPATSNAIVAFTGLRKLSLTSGYCMEQDNLRNMLIQLRSSIRSLSIDLHQDDKHNATGDPITLLEGVAPHLEELSVGWAELMSDEGPEYPCLKRLSCTGLDTSEIMFCQPLIRAFPSLLWLELPETMDNINDEVEERRLENIFDQQGLQWHHLAYLKGPLVSLYGLALQCPVTTLHLEAVEDAMGAAPLRAVLRDSQPLHLVIDAYHVFPFTSVPNIFEGAALHMKDLAIRMHIRDDGPSVQLVFVCIAF